MVINNKNYELIEQHYIADLASEGFILKHKKSGARVVLLSNDDDNKVFHIAFRTPPADDTGVAHIVEHSTLCGSAKYLVKDPFVELCKGSLNTFLNAMTYPDKTIYPVASCNLADFKNIMDVYLDAVFHPAMYEHDEIFRQEGWHYEAEDTDGPITYNGVVYNEMKGAFSDPDDMLNSYIFKSLFPDNAYGKESGGDPEYIPELTYEDFLSFHKKYYHPSNSYIYLYGDMDMNERLDYMDREYLSHYDEIKVDSQIQVQKAFDKPVYVTGEYAVTEDEGTDNKALLSYNTVVADVLDAEKYIAFQIIEYALISAPGAPLKKVLTDAGLGTDIYGSYENSVYQPFFSIIAKNADAARQKEFEDIIKNTLSDIVKNGINKKAFLAGINYFEFKYKEADFGSFPKGLMLGLQAMDSWLYDDSKPFIHIESGEIFKNIRQKVESGYFEELIDTYLLKNNHASYVTMLPSLTLNDEKERKLEEKLAKYKASLSIEQIKKIADDTKALKEYQDEPSPQEALETIPMLSRKDMSYDIAPVYIDEKDIAGVKAIHSNIFTSGIVYLRLSFDCKYLADDKIPYLGLLCNVLGGIDTENYEYFELFNEINIHTGGISTSSTIYTDEKDTEKYRICCEVKAKTLYDNISKTYELIKEMLFNSKLDDTVRLKEIIAQLKSRLQSRIIGGGHTAAISQGMSQFSESVYYINKMSGIDFYRFIAELDENFEAKKYEICEGLKETARVIFNRDNLIIGITADGKGYEMAQKATEAFVLGLLEKTPADIAVRSFKPANVKTAFLTSSQVNYVARTGNYAAQGYKYTGALKVLKIIFSYDYLWINVRVKGGAYGCMSGFYKNGDSYMVSYRDPNIEKTNEIYEHAWEYVRDFNVSERDMTKYIIGTIGEMDTPMTPSAKGNYSFVFYMSNTSKEKLTEERRQVIDATAEDIRNLYPLIKAVTDENYLCVIGNAENIRSQKDMFDELKTLGE